MATHRSVLLPALAQADFKTPLWRRPAWSVGAIAPQGLDDQHHERRHYTPRNGAISRTASLVTSSGRSGVPLPHPVSNPASTSPTSISRPSRLALSSSSAVR